MSYEIGQEVEVRIDSQWLPGRIVFINRDSQWSLVYHVDIGYAESKQYDASGNTIGLEQAPHSYHAWTTHAEAMRVMGQRCPNCERSGVKIKTGDYLCLDCRAQVPA